MVQKIHYEIKESIVSLAGTCFWYWGSFYSFLDSCGVPKKLQEKFPREAYNKYQVMRNILEYLEDHNEAEVINNIVSNFFRLTNAIDRDVLDNKKAKQMLSDFRALVGSDPIEKEIEKREQKEVRKRYQVVLEQQTIHNRRIEDLNNIFIKLTNSIDNTPQQRGYLLENLFCDLLQISELEYSRPYRTADGEQIDGHFRYEKFDYLLEVKWEDGPIKQKDLSIFDGKIRGKAQSTRGLFLSANGFDENAVNKFTGDSPRILLMTGEDLAFILNGRVLFHDAMKAKVEAIVRYGNINFAVRSI